MLTYLFPECNRAMCIKKSEVIISVADATPNSGTLISKSMYFSSSPVMHSYDYEWQRVCI